MEELKGYVFYVLKIVYGHFMLHAVFLELKILFSLYLKVRISYERINILHYS